MRQPALAICLSALGLRDYRVALGTVAFYTALVDSLGLDEDREKFLEALADRDYPLLESIAGNAGVDEDSLKVLWRTLELSGTRDGLSQVRKMASNDAMDDAIRHLVDVRDLVADAGFEDALVLDFGLYQDLTYYSGVIFEAYASGVGLPIASGGRYDGLLERFEWDIPGSRLRHRPRPAARGARRGGQRALRRSGLHRLRGRTRRAGEDHGAASRRLGGRRPATRRGGAGSPTPAPQRRLVRSEPADGEAVSGNWRDVLRALGIV